MKFVLPYYRWLMLGVVALLLTSVGVLFAAKEERKSQKDDPHFALRMKNVLSGKNEDTVDNVLSGQDGTTFDYCHNGHHHLKRPDGTHVRDNTCPNYIRKNFSPRANGHITQTANFRKVTHLRSFLTDANIHD